MDESSAFTPYISPSKLSASMRKEMSAFDRELFEYTPSPSQSRNESMISITTPFVSPLRAQMRQNTFKQRSVDESEIRKRKYWEEDESLAQTMQKMEEDKKQIEMLQAEVTSLREQLRAKDKINEELEDTTTELRSQIVTLQKDSKHKELDLQMETTKNQELTTKVKWLSDEMKEMKNKLLEKDSQIAALNERTKFKAEGMDQQKVQLQQELLEARKTIGALKGTIEANRVAAAQVENRLISELDLAKQQLASCRGDQSKFQELEKECQRLKQENSALKIKLNETSGQSSRISESEILIKSLRRELEEFQAKERAYTAAVREYSYLKGELQNQEILKQRIKELEAKLERAEPFETECTQLKVVIEELKQDLQKWEKLHEGLDKNTTPTQVAKRLTELYKENEILLEKFGTVNAENSSLKAAVQESQAQIQRINTANAELQQQLEQLRFTSMRQEKYVAMLKRETEGLKSILESYNEAKSDLEQPQIKTIQQLEQTILEKDALIEFLDKQLQTIESNRKSGNSNGVSIGTAEFNELKAATVENAKLKKEIQELCNEVATLQQRVGKGEYNRQTTKVLHMTFNPEVRAQQESQLAKVLAENDSLKKQLEDLRAVNARMEVGPSNPSDIMALKEENEQLLKKVQEGEKMVLRLKEVFKKKIHEFREIIYLIFGYKIDIHHKQYKLQSMYAEQDTDFILFSTSQNGQLDLLATDFTEGLSNEITAFLSKCNSIPAFMSNITLDLFNKRTYHQPS